MGLKYKDIQPGDKIIKPRDPNAKPWIVIKIFSGFAIVSRKQFDPDVKTLGKSDLTEYEKVV